jgi:hypothetical protein
MPNTTNYSFPTPADTDLVKNGADAIRDLGDAVDTAMNTALGTKKAGMVLLNTTSFSGVASQSINDVFTSTYDNYFIILNVTPTGNTNQSFRLRASGSDNSTANYFQTIAGLTTGGAADNFTGTGATRHDIGRSNSGNPFAFHLNIFNPQKNVFTSYTQIGQSNDSASLRINHMGSGSFGTTAQFDGITFFPTSAVNITGSISIYGYNK